MNEIASSQFISNGDLSIESSWEGTGSVIGCPGGVCCLMMIVIGGENFEGHSPRINFRVRNLFRPKMHLMVYKDPQTGKRVYTLKKIGGEGSITKSAHPARFSPDDKFSRQRVILKKRYGIFLRRD